MTLLHLIAWLGGLTVGLVVLVGIALGARLLYLGVQDRRHPVLDDDQADDEPIIPSRFTPFVPPHQPHRVWSDVKDGRSTPPPSDPAS